MKKILLIGTAALGMFFMTTSCLENIEPAGIEAMRQAKAELISAQAAYKAAETAYLTAQQALVDAEVAKKEIENQMMEIDLQAKQLDLEMQQAQNEHDIRILELDYLLRQSEDEARQKELESEISYWEYVIAKNQMDTELLENEREQALEKHKAKMLKLQAATAQAQYDYDQALRNLAVLEVGMTQKEKRMLNRMTSMLEGQRDLLQEWQNSLVAADRELTEFEYTWKTDSTYYYKKYSMEVESAKRELALVEGQLDFAAEITDQDSWAAKNQETLEEMQAIEAQINDLRVQALAKEAEKEPYVAEQKALYLQIDSLGRIINDLNAQISGGESALDARATFEIEVPASIVPYVGGTFVRVFQDESEETQGTDALVIISGFKMDPATDEYTLPDGKFVYETSYRTAEKRLKRLSRQITVLTAPEITTLENALADAEKAYNDEIIGTKTLYDFYTGIFEKGLAEYNAIAAVYGITDRELNRENLWTSAAEAYNDLLAIPADATDADIKELIDVIAQEQMLRDSLDGLNMIDYRTVTLENYKAGTLDFSLLGSYYASQPYTFTGYDISYSINPESTEAEINGYSAMELWCTASEQLYAMEYLTEALTLTDVGYGVVFTLDYNFDIDNPGVTMEDIDDNANYNAWLTRMGYADESDFRGSLLYRELADRELMSYIESQITNNADYATLATAIETDIADINALSETDGETNKALYAQIRDLYEQQSALNDQIKELDAPINSIDFEIGKIISENIANAENILEETPAETDYSQAATLLRQYNRLQERSELLSALLEQDEINIVSVIVGGEYFNFDFTDMTYTIGYYEVNPTEFTFDYFVDVYTDSINEQIEECNKSVSDAQKKLDLLENNEGKPMQQVREDLERALEWAQFNYDKSLEIFNILNEKLNALLDVLAGASENPETPEA